MLNQHLTKLFGKAGQIIIWYLGFLTASWAVLQSVGHDRKLLWWAVLVPAGVIWTYVVACLRERESSATLDLYGNPHARHRFRGRFRHALVATAFLIPAALLVSFKFAVAPTPKGDRDTLILVADFDGPDAEYGVTEAIFEELRRLEKLDPQLRIRSAGVKITSKEGPAVAERIARDNAASVIVWGWYRATSEGVVVNAHYQIPEDSCATYFGSTVRKIVGDIRDLSCFNIQSNLSAELAVLASITAGLAHYSGDRYSDASRHFSAALAQSRLHPTLLNRRSRARLSHLAGFSAWMVRDLDNAEVLFDSATHLNPEYWRSHAGRGYVWADRGDYAQALEFLNTAIRISADDPEAIGARGEIHRRAGNFGNAQKDLDYAITIRPAEWWLYNERAKLASAQGDYVSADKDYSKALSFDHLPDACRSEIYNNRGHVRYARFRQDPKALAAASSDFTAALELRPTYGVARRNRALAYSRLGFVRRAYSDYSRMLSTEPDNYEARLARGRLLLDNLSRPSDAIEDFDAAIRVQPQLPDAFYHRGVAHLRMGSNAQARRDFERVLQRTSNAHWIEAATFWMKSLQSSQTTAIGRVSSN